VRSIKESCLELDDPVRRGIVAGGHSDFVAHYHSERNQQGLANRLILPEAIILETLARSRDASA
jgi:hypothetical protein